MTEGPQKDPAWNEVPSIYPGGPDDILGDIEEQQVIALRGYILTLGER